MWKQMGHSVFNNLMYLWIVVEVFWMWEVHLCLQPKPVSAWS